MSRSFSVTPDGAGGFAVAGAIDAAADLTPALAGSGPLRISFRGVTGINSLGVAKFVAFVDGWNGRAATYVDVALPLVDAFIMLPALLGPEDNTAHIESVAVAYQCAKCKGGEICFVGAKEIKRSGDTLSFPPRPCAKCKATMSAEKAAEEYIELALSGALVCA